MIKIILFFLVAFNSAVFAIAQKNRGFYLYVPKDFPNEVKSDLIALFGKATRENWQISTSETEANSGVVLKIAENNSFKTKESFLLQTNGINSLTITSSSNEGLIFGVYKHLRQLGFQFFLPGDDYVVIPKLNNPFGSKKNIVDNPFLQIRDFFGTGGFGSGNSDPDKLVEKAWNLWRLRNGFGSAYFLGGHRGEDFILDNKKVLKEHPDWLVTPLTGNDYNDQGIKLNYLNKEAVDFYANWTIKPFKQPGFVLPPPNHTEFVSIEPSDGGGYLNERQPNKSLPSISDQVYIAANLAAQKLDKLFPGNPNIGVNLYAYNSHAAPPSFPLNPRVFVQLIPYQFQNIAFGPSFIKLWSSKVKRYGLYDYYNYTDAQYDLPGGMTIETAMKRLVHSVRNGSEGTIYETSYSKFATGIPLWILGRYMADGDAGWQKNLETLTRSLYKEASPKIARLFQLFYNQSSFGPQYMGNAVNLLNEANALTKNNDVQKRLDELKEYLQFVHLVYQSRDTKNGTAYQRLPPLAEYAWKLYPRKIVHSYRIMQLVSYAFLNIDKKDKDYVLYQQLHVKWFPETERSKSSWAGIQQNPEVAQINKDFETLKNFYKRSTPLVTYSIADIQNLVFNSFTPKKTLVIGGGSLVRGYFGVYTDQPATLTIKYKIDGDKPSLTFSSIDQGYTRDTAIIVNKNNGVVTIKLPQGETTVFMNAGNGCTYRLQADINHGLYFFDGAPRGKMAFYKNFSDAYDQYTYQSSFYPSHIYIPKNLASIDYRVQGNTLAITSSSGRKIKSDIVVVTNDDFETRRFSAQPGETGKIWKAEVLGNFNYNFLNIPDRYMLLAEK